MNTFVTLFTIFCSLASTSKSLETDLVFDRLAHQLELVRNQIDLTIENQISLSNDLQRQTREFESFGVYQRIPLKKFDKKSDSSILNEFRDQFNQSLVSESVRLTKIKFTTPWKAASKKIPDSISFDQGVPIREDQIVDRRGVLIEFKFTNTLPTEPLVWASKHAQSTNRLIEIIEPIELDKKSKTLIAKAQIFRFQDLEYPKLTPPDLSKYAIPQSPMSNMQKMNAKRISHYREEISKLWPKAIPYLDSVREFAMNDLRMNFYMKHVKNDSR